MSCSVTGWKSCDNNVINVDLDLSGLAGKTVQFVLIVKAEGAWDNDTAQWIFPRIVR